MDVVLLDEIIPQINVFTFSLLVKVEKIKLFEFYHVHSIATDTGTTYLQDIDYFTLQLLKMEKKLDADSFLGREFWIEKREAERLLPPEKTAGEIEDTKARALNLIMSWIEENKMERSNVTRARVMDTLGEAGFGCYESPIFKFVWKEIPEMKKNRGGAPINNPK